MHSMKNTAVAVMLLAVSFGLYQYSLTEKKPEIDPRLIPEMSVSDGSVLEGSSDLMFGGTGASPAASNNSAVVKSSTPPPTFPSTSFPTNLPAPNLSIPELAEPPLQPDFKTDSNQAFGTSFAQIPPADAPHSDRKPVIAKTNDNVQTIEYPSSPTDFTAIKRDFAPPRQPTTEISQRELVSAEADAGLIEALEKELSQVTPPRRESNSVNGNNQFGGNSFLAAPISSTNTEVANTTNEAASASMPAGRDFADAAGTGFDTNVTQAGSELLLPEKNINAAWAQVDRLVAANDFHAALKLLSPFYRSEELSGPQRQRLLGWLDALAGKVIFSAENYLADQPYTVGPNESLPDIAQKWKVPAQLIFNVNRDTVANPAIVSPGTKLKPLPGPFSSEIDLQAGVLTLFLGDLYAGRFPIVVGISGEPKPGDYSVMLKSAEGYTWRDSNGVDYPPGTPQNGYGENWIGLSGSLCIHAIAEDAAAGHHGCIGLKASDAADVFAILTESSRVKILR